MALDIGVGDGFSSVPARGEPTLFRENDGCYWFLHPLFERLRAETGQYIDLYGDASFAGDELAALERMLAEARTLVASRPETWREHGGTEVSPDHRELYRLVEREVMLALLDRWGTVARRARELGRPVVFFGD
jgi:hypothetical protein